MQQPSISHNEEDDKRKGVIWSSIIHGLLLLCALLPLVYFPNPPPEQEGIQIAFGMPDAGANDAPTPDESPTTPSKPVEEEVIEKPKPTPPPTKPNTPEKNVLTTDDPDAIAIKKKKEAEQKRKAQEEADKKKKAEEAENTRKKAEEARLKAAQEAAEEAKRREEAKSKFKIPGKGQGSNPSNSGNQGDPNGDPNADKLDGITKGKGQVGGGLSDRGVQNRPNITDNSQETGKVVVKVCVDKDGKVSEAEYTQSGSTTSSSRLKSLAVATAKQYTFSPSEAERQCGTITFDFRLQ